MNDDLWWFRHRTAPYNPMVREWTRSRDRKLSRWGSRISGVNAIRTHADVDLSSVLKEAAFAHERQKVELGIVIIPSQIAKFLFRSEHALVVRWVET